jgi:hypothetical protein
MTTPTRPGLLNRALALLVPLILFAAAYSAGATVKKAAANDEPSQSVPAAAEPSPLPTATVLLPGIRKPAEVPLRSGVPQSYVVGHVHVNGGIAFDNAGLPFALRSHDTQTWRLMTLEESSYAIYRGVRVGKPPKVEAEIWVAAHPCEDLAGCLSERPAFDDRWTKRFKAAKPATVHDAQTWYTETKTSDPHSYAVSMTRVFRSAATNSWWLVGVEAGTRDAEQLRVVQSVINDIRTQTT